MFNLTFKRQDMYFICKILFRLDAYISSLNLGGVETGSLYVQYIQPNVPACTT